MINKILRVITTKTLLPAKRYLASKGKTKRFKYDNFSIELPYDHLLPNYQRDFKRYDRFLPHLASKLTEGTVIDVGANVGDTLASMADKNTKLQYICIEGDSKFYQFLLRNTKILKEVSDIYVDTYNILIGKNIKKVILEGNGSTNHGIIDDQNGLPTEALDTLLKNKIPSPVILVKSDVDGFDYDVISSAFSILKEYKPLCFFECQYDFEWQKAGFVDLINNLEYLGYNSFTIFDNFGEIIVTLELSSQIFEMMEYIWRQNVGDSVRTINYFDILASTPERIEFVNEVLETYY
jgi:FkbM family methyltransferase